MDIRYRIAACLPVYLFSRQIEPTRCSVHKEIRCKEVGPAVMEAEKAQGPQLTSWTSESRWHRCSPKAGTVEPPEEPVFQLDPKGRKRPISLQGSEAGAPSLEAGPAFPSCAVLRLTGRGPPPKEGNLLYLLGFLTRMSISCNTAHRPPPAQITARSCALAGCGQTEEQFYGQGHPCL